MHTSVMIHYNQQHLYPLLFNNKQELEMWIQTEAYQKTDSRTYSLLHNTWVFYMFPHILVHNEANNLPIVSLYQHSLDSITEVYFNVIQSHLSIYSNINYISSF